MLWDRLHLTSEGNLTACCVDYENDLVYKKFTDSEKIIDQFNSDKIVDLKDKNIKNNLKNTICYNCIYNENSEYNKINEKIMTTNEKTNNFKKLKKKLLKSRIDQFVKEVQ